MEGSQIERIDFTVFGATGYAGQFCAVEAALLAQELRMTWAVAGRNLDKMKKVVAANKQNNPAITTDPIFIIADSGDEESLREMAKMSRVLISAVGPYRTLGMATLRACVSENCDYVDICGEPFFIESARAKLSDKAKENGCTCVTACGFDSLPAELGTVLACKELKKAGAQPDSVEMFHSFKPSGSGAFLHHTTWDAFVDSLAGIGELISLRKSLPRSPHKPQGKPIVQHKAHFFEPRVQEWNVPFFGSDSSVVRTSQQLLAENGLSKPVHFGAYAALKNKIWVYVFIGWFAMISFLIKYKLMRFLMHEYPVIFTFGCASASGPSQKSRLESTLQSSFFAKGSLDSGEQHAIRLNMTCFDPGYSRTAVMAVACAAQIRTNPDKVPKGVITPGYAFAGVSEELREALEKKSVEFSLA